MRRHTTLVFLAALSLAACGDERSEPAESADNFADRIGGSSSEDPNAPQTAPRVETPEPGAAPGPREAGTMTDARASNCGAVVAAAFLGRYADENARASLAETAQAAGGVRFFEPGNDVRADPRSNRLNVMLDGDGVIRDLRCG